MAHLLWRTTTGDNFQTELISMLSHACLWLFCSSNVVKSNADLLLVIPSASGSSH